MQENNNIQGTGVNKLLLALVIVEAVAIIALLVMMNNRQKESERLISQIEIGNMEKGFDLATIEVQTVDLNVRATDDLYRFNRV